MSANGEQNPIKELEWLAHYYHQHGFPDKAKEILERLELSRHQTNNVVDMFENDADQRRA
jgi:hypothetical protein